MPTWISFKLGDLLESISITHSFEKNEVVFLNTSDILEGKVLHQNKSRVDGLPGQAKKSIGRGDILFSEIRPANKRYAFIDFDCDDYVVSTKLMVLRHKNKAIDIKFLYKWLTSEPILLELQNIAESRSGTFPQITFDILSELEISAPEDLPTQTRITSILSALDDKIELNRQMNHTLEQMALALFKKYFVDDIDPQHLPEGWRWGKIGEYIESVSITHKFPNPTIIFLNTSDILSGEVLHQNQSDINTLPGQAKKSIKKNDILFSEIRPANRRFAFMNFEADNYAVSTKLMVLRAKGDIHPLFFYYYLTQDEILDELQNIAESRSGTFPQITFDQVKDLKFAIPNDDRLKKFIEKVLIPSYEKIYLNLGESKNLSTLRDSLLPKLMSGELEVTAKTAHAVLS